MFAVRRKEKFAEFAPLFVPYGNILQVRIGRTQSSGSRYSLIERGMNLSGFRMNQSRQRIDIRTQQFLDSTIFQQLVNDRVFTPNLFQNFFTGTITTGFGFLRLFIQFQLIKQDLTNLFGGINIE